MKPAFGPAVRIDVPQGTRRSPWTARGPEVISVHMGVTATEVARSVWTRVERQAFTVAAVVFAVSFHAAQTLKRRR